MRKIKIGIAGYGNLGKGVEIAIRQNQDMELAAIFTRRDPGTIKPAGKSVPVFSVDKAASMQEKIDVMILCGGSAKDLPEQGPLFAAWFNTVDSFDTHAKIEKYFTAVDKAASKNCHVAIISVGWDPGLFSLNRLYAESILPEGAHYTFWGKGVSQGHSDAIRTIQGVKNAVQYTLPVQSAIDAIRKGATPTLSTRQKHTRECFVVPEDGADRAKIEKTIKTMPDYFADYDTTVRFISEDELKADHGSMPHGGFVLRSGRTGKRSKHVIEYSLKLDSNPEFTGNVMVCYARAAYRLSNSGGRGAKTVFDIAPALLSPRTSEALRMQLL